MNEERNMIWLRLGCAMYVTPEEAKILMDGKHNLDQAEKLVHRLIRENQWDPSGDTYIPEQAVVDYNADYGTNFPEQEVDLFM